MELPKLFEENMQMLLKEEYNDYKKSFEKPSFTGLRVNTMKISPEGFEKICPYKLSKVPWTTNGYYYNKEEQPARHPYYYAGLYYIQEPSAMTPASFMPVNKGDKVLDLCAAPGGKSTELAAKLDGTGLLVSNDISNSRAKALLKNLELFGTKNSIVTSETPEKLATYFPEYFDKILIDAPCSGEGMFRKDPAIIKNWEECGPSYYSQIQKEIIITASKMLKPGGLIMFSTCTFDPLENEETIMHLLKQCPDFTIEELPHFEGFDNGKSNWCKDENENLSKCVRIWPHKTSGEGHFIALVKKNETYGGRYKPYSYKKQKEIESFYDFSKNLNLSFDEERFDLKGEKLYYLPEELPDLKGLRMLRSGLYLGDIKKGRFEPSQSLASSLKVNEFKNIIKLDINDENVIKYLKCETIDVDSTGKNGYHLVTVEGFPLGWGKLNNTTLKNKYSAGWRWM